MYSFDICVFFDQRLCSSVSSLFSLRRNNDQIYPNSIHDPKFSDRQVWANSVP